MIYTDKTLITRPITETPDQRKAREKRREPVPMVSYCVSRWVPTMEDQHNGKQRVEK